jgi:SAM-dependent methyltransferase
VRFRNKGWQPAAFYATGGDTLEAQPKSAASDMRGKTLLHLQCATGEDTLSWAVLGAQVTGADISDLQIDLARQKAAQAGLDVSFVAADVYALPEQLQRGTFDWVYTGGGALVWLPDIARWARVVAAALRPGGRLMVWETHPITGCLWMEGGRLVVESDYFGRGEPDYAQGWSHFRGGEGATETKAEFSWPLGDIVTAVARAGLRIESLEEFPPNEDDRYRLGGPTRPDAAAAGQLSAHRSKGMTTASMLD